MYSSIMLQQVAFYLRNLWINFHIFENLSTTILFIFYRFTFKRRLSSEAAHENEPRLQT